MNCLDIFTLVSLIFLVVLITSLVVQNNLLLRHADQRLDKANEMVLKLSHSCDILAHNNSELKDMLVHLEQVYTARNDTMKSNYDKIYDSYVKLLHKYEDLEGTYIDELKHYQTTVHELARRPTTNNTNNIA